MRLVDLPQNPLPPGALVELLETSGLLVRVARWHPPSARTARGTVLVMPGRSEFIEKYAEVVGDLLARDFVVVVLDWRGQGGSSRLLPNPRKGHIDGFGDYLGDLDVVARDILLPTCPRPWFGLAHSMGGAIVMDHAARGACLFDRLVLSAPMVDLHGLRFIGLIRVMARVATALGFGGAYVPGGSDATWMTAPFAGNALTSDRRRFAAFTALARAAPELTLGSPTQGWLHAAFRLMHRLNAADFGAGVTTPTLVVACGADRIVATPAIERFAASLKAGHLVVVPHARHEILMEQDRYKAQFWAAFDAFVPGST